MSEISGRTVRLFLVDGSQSGLITAEIINWTGHILTTPRSNIGEALKRDEAGRTGVYFLVGEDPAQPTKVRVYIGEADVVADRIRTHAKDESKEFWTRACFVTSKDPNLTKAHVRYLENRLIELTKLRGRANLANGNEPGSKPLPESDVADMEFFLSQLELILPVLGFDFLKPKATAEVITETSSRTLVPQQEAVNLYISSKKHGLEARAVTIGEEFTVRQGSGALTEEFTQNSYKSLRQQLIEDGRIMPAQNPLLLQFTEDVSFASPSAASSVIFNRNTNGRVSWKLEGTEMTLKDWQDRQISGD